MLFVRKIINNAKYKVLFLFILALLPRIIGLGQHDIFVDEITWMSRCKDVYAAVRTLSWSPYNSAWWLIEGVAEAIGLPVTFLGGISMTYLSPGYSTHSLNISRDFVTTRFPVALIGTFFIPVFYLLLRKFVNDKLAFIASLLLALDPIAIALSRWFQHDTALMVFSTLSILLYLYSKRKIAIVGSSFLAAMAILTKPQGFLIVVVLAAVTLFAFGVKQKTYIKEFVIWLVLSGIFTVAFFPYLWTNPIGNMFHYLSIQLRNVSAGNLTFFSGQITTNPPWYYYFAIFPFRLPESILIGFFIGLVVFIISFKKKLLGNSLFQAVGVYTILFFLIITLSNKKLGIRYLFGIWPYIYILVAYGLMRIEKFISCPFRKVYWLIVFLFPVWGILKFYPSYYLFYNHLITPQKYQNLESVGYCDSVKPAIEYLGPNLYHGIKIMLTGCDAAINYYTNFTINSVYSVNEKPDYVIEENISAQKLPGQTAGILKAGYRQIKEINFRGLILAKIYQKP